MATGVVSWSKTAATNATADSAVNFAEGMAPSAVNDSARGLMASAAKWRDDLNGSLATAGGTLAFTLTTNQVFAALTAGYQVAFQMNATNTGTTTLNVDGLGAKPLRSAAGVELLAGSLLIGAIYKATYFTSNSGEWLVESYPVLGDAQIAAAKLASNAVTTAKILDANVTLAKLANVSATQRIIGRKTAAAGVPEECTLSDILDFISTTDGDALVRTGGAWARVAKGTSGQVWTQGATVGAWSTPLFSAEYTSSDLTASVSTGATLTHGLGAIPKLVQLFLVCQSTDNGYTTGDVVPYGNTGASVSTTSGVSVTVTATTIVYKQSSNVLYLPNKSSGDTSNLTMANWKLRFKAWA